MQRVNSFAICSLPRAEQHSHCVNWALFTQSRKKCRFFLLFQNKTFSKQSCCCCFLTSSSSPESKMSRKKGLSMEEKRVRLLELFHEKQEPFLLKDLEKAATKEKGIPLQTVKDVLTSLVSDDMVDTDKIGTSVYFWSFPSKNSTIKANKIKELEEKVKELEEKDTQLEAEIAEKLKSSSESEEEAKRRSELQDELVAAEKESAEVAKELAKFESCDPDTFEKKKEEIETLREGVERWTDNIFAIRTYCKNKFNMEYSEIDRQLGFPPDLDYFELDEDK